MMISTRFDAANSIATIIINDDDLAVEAARKIADLLQLDLQCKYARWVMISARNCGARFDITDLRTIDDGTLELRLEAFLRHWLVSSEPGAVSKPTPAVAKAVARLWPADRDRYQEEWMADERDIEGRIRRWRWSVGIRLSAYRLAKRPVGRTRVVSDT
jgi:hypothetical protein